MSTNKRQVYMDYAATHPLSSATKEYLIPILDMYGNPSSQYELSDKVRKIIYNSRQAVANFIGCSNPENIIFTSSGSASNALGIKGYILKHPNTHIYYSPIAHKSILNIVSNKGIALPVNFRGDISLSDLRYMLKNDDIDHKLLVIDYANSEIGTIQNIRKIIDICHDTDTVIMIDITGSISTIPFSIKNIDADIVCFSGHKIGALKGMGVLYKKDTIDLEPLIYGSQEQGLFSGTENVLGIASLYSSIIEYDYIKESSVEGLRNFMWEYLHEIIPDTYLIGADIYKGTRLINNLYICFKGVEAGTLLTLLSSDGIYVSTGSACNSGNNTPSPTLLAIDIDKEDLHSCIRFTLNHTHTREEIIEVCNVIKGYVELLKNN